MIQFQIFHITRTSRITQLRRIRHIIPILVITICEITPDATERVTFYQSFIRRVESIEVSDFVTIVVESKSCSILKVSFPKIA